MTYIHAAIVRAIRTAAQVAIASIGSTTLIDQVQWDVVGSTTALAAVLSILMSLTGLPEAGTQAPLER